MGQEGFDGKNDQATKRDRIIECLRENPARARAMLDVGAIESGHVPGALSWLRSHRHRLRRLWAVARRGHSGARPQAVSPEAMDTGLGKLRRRPVFIDSGSALAGIPE
jgi:hypothetical protein